MPAAHSTVQAAPPDGLRTIDLSEHKMGHSFETLYGLWADAGLDLSQRRPRALYLYGRCDALCPCAFDARLLHLACRVPHALRLLRAGVCRCRTLEGGVLYAACCTLHVVGCVLYACMMPLLRVHLQVRQLRHAQQSRRLHR